MIFTSSAYAQFSIGLRGGYGLHGVYFEPQSLNGKQVAYQLPNAGLVIIYNNMNNAGLQIELNYAQKGWKEEEKLIEGSEFKRTISYFELPVLTHWQFGKKSLRAMLIIGPYVAYKLNESTESVNFGPIFTGHRYDHYHQKIRDLDFGLKAGVGLRYNFAKRFAVYAEFRYGLHVAGGQNIFKNQPNKIQASRYKEIGGGFGIIWHIFEQEKPSVKEGYIPKENIIEKDEQ